MLSGYVSATSLQFHSSEGSAAAPQSQFVDLKLTGDERFAINYVTGAAFDWLNVTAGVGNNSGKLRISASPENLRQGNYQARVYIVPKTSLRATVVDVYYNVLSKGYPLPTPVDASAFDPSSLTFSIGIDTLKSDLTKTVTVVGEAGNTWSASTPVSWISLSKTTGSAGDTVSVSIVPAGLKDNYEFNYSYGNTARAYVNFTFKSSTGGTFSSNLSISASKVALPSNWVDSAPLSFIASPDSSLEDISKSIVIGIAGSNSTWTASTYANWISLSSFSGAAGDVLALSLIPSVINNNYSGQYYYSISLTLKSAFGITYTSSISLSLSVGGLSANYIWPSPLQFNLNSTSTPADLTKQIKVGSTGASTWSAQSPASWVIVQPISGKAGDSPSVILNANELAKVETNPVSTSITFTITTATNFVYTSTVSVNVNNTMAKFSTITPHVVLTGLDNQVVLIRGAGLAKDTKPIIDGVEVANATFVSEYELKVTLPKFSADGAHTVSVAVANPGLASLQPSVNLISTTESALSGATTLSYPNTAAKRPLRVIYDAERHALLVGVAYPPTTTKPAIFGEIIRYIDVGGNWLLDNAAKSLSVADLSDFALSNDAQSLIAVSKNSMSGFDPVTFAASGKKRTISASGYASVVVANDAQAMVLQFENYQTNLYRYSLRDWLASPAIIVSNYTPNYSNVSEPNRLSISLDGSRVAYNSIDYYGHHVQQYSASAVPTNFAIQSTSFSLTQGSIIQLDRSASRLVVNNTNQYMAYDATVMNTPVSVGVLGVTGGAWSLISHAGDRLYTCCTYVTSGANATATMHTYDLNSWIPSTGYAEIGTGLELPQDPGNGGTGGAGYKMAISLDGRTLFIAGDNAIVALPTP